MALGHWQLFFFFLSILPERRKKRQSEKKNVVISFTFYPSLYSSDYLVRHRKIDFVLAIVFFSAYYFLLYGRSIHVLDNKLSLIERKTDDVRIVSSDLDQCTLTHIQLIFTLCMFTSVDSQLAYVCMCALCMIRRRNMTTTNNEWDQPLVT
jgi:hypothetical protein